MCTRISCNHTARYVHSSWCLAFLCLTVIVVRTVDGPMMDFVASFQVLLEQSLCQAVLKVALIVQTTLASTALAVVRGKAHTLFFLIIGFLKRARPVLTSHQALNNISLITYFLAMASGQPAIHQSRTEKVLALLMFAP